jgi:hypothetical protein
MCPTHACVPPFNTRGVFYFQHQMATPQSRDSTYQEGRIELAINDFKQGKFRSLRAAALAYDVCPKTTKRRASGIAAKRASRAPNRKLSPTEEETLKLWIISMDERGMPPRIATVRQMANLLLAKRSNTTTPPIVGQNWVRAFVDRDDELKSKYNRKYDYQRAKCKDPTAIRAWFKHVNNAIEKFGIAVEDQYNFDETGFQMGVIGTARVVTGTDRAGRPRTTQPGNRTWVTTIEAISAAGFLLPLLIILEALMHQTAWYRCGIPPNWSIGVSANR